MTVSDIESQPIFLVIILLSGVKRLHEEPPFPLTWEEVSVSGCVTEMNVINYQL